MTRASDCGELNAVAVEWVDGVDAELGQYMTASSLAEFQYQTNLTEYNERQVRAGCDICVHDRLNR